MEKWSAELERFKINFFLDTNILCYLIDDTYPTLTGFVKAVAEMPVVSLFASEYVLAELIEVRKKEDYYQEVVRQSQKDGRYINISSFITHNKKYNIPHYSYEGEIVEPVVTQVDKDIEKIVKDFGIVFDSRFNNQMLAPMKEICLTTKISKEDSLVLVSSQFRDDKKVFPNKVILLTNDDDFEKWSNTSKEDIEKVLKEKGLTMPYVENIRLMGKMFGDNSTHWDLRNDGDSPQIAREYVKNCLHKLFEDYFIGVVSPGEKVTKAPKHTLFMKVKAASLYNNLYAIVLDKNLTFLYCPQNKADFYVDGKSISEPFTPERGKDKVGFVCEMREREGEDIFERLNKKGNMVFIHPDSF